MTYSAFLLPADTSFGRHSAKECKKLKINSFPPSHTLLRFSFGQQVSNGFFPYSCLTLQDAQLRPKFLHGTIFRRQRTVFAHFENPAARKTTMWEFWRSKKNGQKIAALYKKSGQNHHLLLDDCFDSFES